MRSIATLLALLIISFSWAQKKSLSEKDYNSWNTLEREQISADGSLISFEVTPRLGDPILQVSTPEGKELLTYKRGSNAHISWDANHVVFRINPGYELERALKRKKTKKDNMPTDSLGIYAKSALVKIADVKDFKLPKEWSGYLAYRTTAAGEAKKKVNDKNGYHLIIRSLKNDRQDTIAYVKGYLFAKKGQALLYESTGTDSLIQAGVYHLDLSNMTTTLLAGGKYKYAKMSLSEDGNQAAFLMDSDTSKALVRNYQLNYWEKGMNASNSVLDRSGLAENWIVSKDGNVSFSESADRVYFGTRPIPLMQDTSLLDDEIVKVEIWNYQDQRLMTEQENRVKQDQKKNYLAAYYPSKKQYVQLADETVDRLIFGSNDRNDKVALGVHNASYLKYTSWEGFPARQDYYVVDLSSGKKTKVAEEIRGDASVSPGNKYLYWYHQVDTAWYAYDIQAGKLINLSSSIPTSMADELDDHPDYPWRYGSAGWTAGDKEFLLYDRFDIWAVNPTNPSKPRKLTDGRASYTRYRYLDLDREDPAIDLKKFFFTMFNERTRQAGYGKLNGNRVQELLKGDFRLGSFQKSKEADQVIFTIENNQKFPDIHSSDLRFASPKKISEANPQQQQKIWSTNEIVSWNSLDGEQLEGILYKPENFDPKKKYPLIVYFYERNSHNLHRHWGVQAHRSVINPNYYASRGYLVFIPDITYRIGYPGPSCYNDVIPGITKLLDQGFVDRDNIGTQGHSWGGYQTAYLVTRTDLFACAESGAPVSNMISAYGGIRWGSGRSRMFQYEHTQSRLGGTLWDVPMRYFENSPIFFVDKINTPLLIMHNDKDGAVPWYQGIEFFVALRRLNKPAWMLNYNDEPHWPTKKENILDFQIRMQQFFDHYLMEKPMPQWMKEGIPAVDKGIDKGY